MNDDSRQGDGDAVVADYLMQVDSHGRENLAEIRREFARLHSDLLPELQEYWELEDLAFSSEKDRDDELLHQLAGYKLVQKIGSGGGGEVYLAVQADTHRFVALKILSGRFVEENKLRFRREARVAAGLRHPNIIAVFEAGEDEGRLYYSMEYCRGGNLQELLSEAEDPPNSMQIVRWFAAIARGLAYAHEQGIFHRDIKPQNILFDSGFRPILADFGLAREQVDAATQLTETGRGGMGTSDFVSPEQYRDAKAGVSVESDIYSLGATLYTALSGRPHIAGQSETERLYLLPTAMPARLTGVPRSLDAICQHCLRKSPEQRYRSAQDLAIDLELFAEGFPPRFARRVGALERIRLAAKRNPVASVLAAALAATTIAALVVFAVLFVRADSLRITADQEKRQAQRERSQKEVERKRAATAQQRAELEQRKAHTALQMLMNLHADGKSEQAREFQRLSQVVFDELGELPDGTNSLFPAEPFEYRADGAVVTFPSRPVMADIKTSLPGEERRFIKLTGADVVSPSTGVRYSVNLIDRLGGADKDIAASLATETKVLDSDGKRLHRATYFNVAGRPGIEFQCASDAGIAFDFGTVFLKSRRFQWGVEYPEKESPSLESEVAEFMQSIRILDNDGKHKLLSSELQGSLGTASRVNDGWLLRPNTQDYEVVFPALPFPITRPPNGQSVRGQPWEAQAKGAIFYGISRTESSSSQIHRRGVSQLASKVARQTTCGCRQAGINRIDGRQHNARLSTGNNDRQGKR